MDYTPITPFRRPMDAARMTLGLTGPCSPQESVDKWQALKTLAVARRSFGLSDRDLTVLETLLGFYPEKLLCAGDVMVVHPANATICARLNGMPSSTMRRHLARLVEAGVVIRRDSPNGKRFARVAEGGKTVYGLDLSPLLTRHAVIAAEAERLTAEAEALRLAREKLALMRRDLAHLAAFGALQYPARDWAPWQEIAVEAGKWLRRTLSTGEVAALARRLDTALGQIRAALEALSPAAQTEETGMTGAQNGRQLQDSDINTIDIEKSAEMDTSRAGEAPEDAKNIVALPLAPEARPAPLPLQMVLSACREIQTLVPSPIRNWAELMAAAESLRPMMGIGTDLWRQAQRIFGGQMAAVVLAAMLERFDRIRSSGAYLRHLARKMAEGRFSVTPMVMALLRPAG